MNSNNKNIMYDYQYSDSVGIPQQIHHIKRIQRKRKKEVKIFKVTSAFKNLRLKKNTTVYSDYTEVEFLGI